MRVVRNTFCIAFALLFLTETVLPLIEVEEMDVIELSENAEEGEEKKEKEKEKEVVDSDEFYSRYDNQSFGKGALITSAFSHLEFRTDSFFEIDTPPPEGV